MVDMKPFVYASVLNPKNGRGRPTEINSFECQISSGNRVSSDDELIANARLIAAAPELLTFVKAMHARHAPSGPRQRCLSCGLDGNCCGTYLSADALIVKAEGK